MNRKIYNARDRLDKTKIEAAMEFNVKNRNEYRGDLTSRENG